MAPQKLTEYERKRLENIRRNEEMIAALHLHAAASQLSAATKRHRAAASSKSQKSSPDKKPKTQPPPVVIRRSLRTRGVPPDSKGLDDDFVYSSIKTPKPVSPVKPPSPRVLGPLSMKDAYSGTSSDRSLIDAFKALSVEKKPHLGVSIKDEISGGGKVVKEEQSDGVSSDLVKGVVKSECPDYAIKLEKREFKSCVDLGSMSLEPENIARVVPGRILVVKFLPCDHLRMVAVGNKFGNVGFWNMDHKEEDDNGKFLYRPHTGPVSAILFQPSCLSKIFTSCYDGFVRLMDAEKEVFDLVYSTDDAIFSLFQKPDDPRSLFLSEGRRGGLNIWDERMGECSSHWTLHEDRINSIDFNSQNSNLMATSSTDGTACLWDLRNIKSHKPKCLKLLNHKRAVHSAYFSPSGSSLATTSADDTVGILSGVNFDDTSMIYHFNQTGRWISSFRAIWGWDDAYVFIGNMKRGVDVISPAERKTVMTLQSPHMSAIPCRFHAHPYKVGMLAGATSGGQVYVWTSS